MKHIETEVKFFVTNPQEVQAALIQLGAVSSGRFFETNLRYEDAGHRFIRSGSLLRLRKDRQATLTLKRPSPEKSSDFKTMQELEVTISDFDTMRDILDAIGFQPVQIYEKWRETFLFPPVTFCMDEMPFGTFLEIEGPGSAIIDIAARLELNWNCRILANYLTIFEKIKTTFRLDFSDVTFQNFDPVKSLFAPTIRGFEAGKQTDLSG